MLRYLALSAVLAVTSARWSEGDHSLWNDYKTVYKMEFESEVEEAARRRCFVRNLDLIDQFNAEEDGAMYGMNEYAHLCHHEFKAHKAGLLPNQNRTKKYAEPQHLLGAPVSFDWRHHGAVTHVKNQGQCGSCWAFSAVGAMEGVHFVKTGKLLDLSEEELVQCSGAAGNMGCNGGIMDKAFDWVHKNGGITSETDYPYTSGMGMTGNCNSKKERHYLAKYAGHEDIEENEQTMAAYLVKNGPISVAVDAGPKWQLYRGGVKTSCFAGPLDHGVLIVGYGVDKGTPYWIIKNSWGPLWGENGYIRVKRGNNCNGVRENACAPKFES